VLMIINPLLSSHVLWCDACPLVEPSSDHSTWCRFQSPVYTVAYFVVHVTGSCVCRHLALSDFPADHRVMRSFRGNGRPELSRSLVFRTNVVTSRRPAVAPLQTFLSSL
jgi:hypothetical protein